jgi:tetratricopeptide (TPR) repeat protein
MTMTSNSRLVAILLDICLCLWLLALPPIPLAVAETVDKKTEARKLFREANRLFKRKMYLDALRKYRQARALYPSYKIDLNIGGTLDELGRRTEAAAYFERFLIQSSDAPAPITKAARSRLDELRKKLASAKVTCLVDGATVLVDGKGAGTTPLEIPLYFEAGTYTIAARKAGHRPSSKELTLSAGQHVVVDLILVREGLADDTPPASQPAGVVRSRATPDPGIARRRREKTIWAYTALSMGAACAVTAGILYGVGTAQGNAAHDRYQAATLPDEIELHYRDVESAKTKLVAGHVLIGVAAAAIGVSIYSFLTRPSAVAATPLRGGLELSVSGRF